VALPVTILQPGEFGGLGLGLGAFSATLSGTLAVLPSRQTPGPADLPARAALPASGGITLCQCTCRSFKESTQSDT